MARHTVIRREEMLTAHLDLGGQPIDLADYATTGLLGLAVGPRGSCKTNAGLLIAEQLSEQGWVCVLIDPESELESLYGDAVDSPEVLYQHLEKRDRTMIVVRAENATEFVPFGKVIRDATDEFRKPIFVMIDEGQMFSATRKRMGDIGDASDIINDLVGRGRKRAVDLFITALRYTGTLHRSVFSNKNLTLIGCQEDPTVWSALAPQFKSSGIDFTDLNTLSPGEFFCVSRRGIEKIRTPMSKALRDVAAPKAQNIQRALPTTFTQWAKAMSQISDDRLRALDDREVTDLLGAVAGLSTQQMQSGHTALVDELEARDEA
jgi:hypothetical protein